MTGRFPAKLLSPLDVQALNCPLSFFATNSYNVLALASAAQAPPSSTSTQRPGKRLPVNAGIQTLCIPFFTVTDARV